MLSVIPVYNGERYLEETLQSLADQTTPPDRVIVIDDCSTDGTVALAESFNSLPVEVVRNEQNLGLFPNLNRALAFADEAEYFHLLLADDRVRPRFIESVVQTLKTTSAYAMAYSKYDWIDAESQLLRRGGSQRTGAPVAVPHHAFIKRQCQLKSVSVGSVIIRSAYSALPVHFRQDMPHVADCVFYAELAAQCTSVWELGEALCEIRRHDENATKRNSRSLNAWVSDEFKAMRRISQLLPRRGWRTTLHDHFLQCLFAARSRVKQQWTRKDDPQYADEIRAVVVRETRWYHRLAGSCVVILRDLVMGRNRPERPR